MLSLPRFEIYQASAGNVALVVCLVKEDIFAIIAAGCGKVLEDAIVVDSVLNAELLPKLRTNLQTGCMQTN